jgi:hypothetical protein
MANPVVYFEIGCRDLAATGSFYAELFGWSVSPAGPAATISTGSDIGIAGHIASLGHEPHQYTIFYVEVEDIEAAQGGISRRQDHCWPDPNSYRKFCVVQRSRRQYRRADAAKILTL